MDNHLKGNVKMYNPDGGRLDFLLRSNYPPLCFRGAARVWEDRRTRMTTPSQTQSASSSSRHGDRRESSSTYFLNFCLYSYKCLPPVVFWTGDRSSAHYSTHADPVPARSGRTVEPRTADWRHRHHTLHHNTLEHQSSSHTTIWRGARTMQ